MKKFFNWRSLSMGILTASFVVLAAGSLEPVEPSNPGNPNPDDSDSKLDPAIEALVAKTIVYTDAASSELMSIITTSNDTISYFGTKDGNGLAKNITTMEYTSSTGMDVFLNFSEDGRIQNITSNVGASVDFEWVGTNTVVLRALSMSDNLVIQTKYDFNNPIGSTEAPDVTNSMNSTREGEFFAALNGAVEYTSDFIQARMNSVTTNYDPDQFADKQQVLLWINQCGASYNAKNYITLTNATTGDYVGKLVNYEHIADGNYVYQLPIKSYPSKATNAEICAALDAALRNMEKWMGWIYVDNGEALGYVLTALNTAAASTGMGAAPAAVVDAVVFAGAAINCGVQIFNSTGGVSALMKQQNAEWYYKEYINSDLVLTPVVYTKGTTVVGEGVRVNPADESIFLSVELEGTPVIDNFTLNPSNPAAGESYVAIAEYHCVPVGSSITLSIIGTDGYHNSRTLYVDSYNVSGTATLNVPGAATGVYDVCDVVITTPSNEVLSMKASLVFGN